MSVFPKAAGHACWIAGRPARESVAWTWVRHVSTAEQATPARTSFQTATPYPSVAAA